MRITPLEIRQKTFEKIFRGYDKEEVATFLTLLSQEWEKINDEKKMLEMRYEQSQKESEKLRQVEDSLFKTLKSAEDTGASIIEQANKTAELILKEARMNAEVLKSDSESEAKRKVEGAASQAKEIMEDLREDVTSLVESYETLLAQREIVLKNLKTIATETIETVNLSKEELKRIDVTAHAKVIKELNRQSSYSAASDRAFKEPKQTIVTELRRPEQEEAVAVEPQENMPEPPEALTESAPKKEEVQKEEVQKEETKKKDSGSFFDQFD